MSNPKKRYFLRSLDNENESEPPKKKHKIDETESKNKIPAKIMFADSDRQYILVNFHSESDVNSFKRAKPNSVLATHLFDIDGCAFCFEITPNGWEGDKVVSVWCSLKALPDNIGAVEVYFQCKCNQVSFSADRTQTLSSTSLTTKIENIEIFYSITTPKGMRCEDFMKLISWSFICNINILKWYDKNGKEITKNYAAKDEAKSDDTEQLQDALIQQRNQSQQTIDDLLNEQTKLVNKNKKFVSQISELNTKRKLLEKVQAQQQKVQAENDKLKKENSNLNEKCKEYKLQLKDIKSKYDEYRKHNINVNDYKNWTHEIIADWILSLDNGMYETYGDVLRKKLKEESMSGEFLQELDKSDLDRFGIKSFGHKSAIIKHIQQLVSSKKKK